MGILKAQHLDHTLKNIPRWFWFQEKENIFKDFPVEYEGN